MDKSVLTLAVGKQVYINMAVALARSFKLWNDPKLISFWIATDNKSSFPKDVKDWVNFIELEKGELGEGFSPKLHLDKISPTRKTLFIDSDCLIVKNIDFVFERFKGKSVSVVGGYISEGEWFGDIRTICQKFNLEKLLKFNGGIYYLEKGEICTKVYSKARELEPQYEAIGFKLLRSKPNDELLMALSMALFSQTPIDDDAKIMSDPQSSPGGTFINVFSGKSLLINPTFPNVKHQNWYPFHKVSPAIIHFLGTYTQKYPYIVEEEKLRLVLGNNIPIYFANFVALITKSIPSLVEEYFKRIFRPIFHLLFGFNKIKNNPRI